MIIDCHLHTEAYSACSHMSADALCRRAVARGVDAVVITEHHQWWPGGELDQLRERHPALRVYNGVELTLEEGYDVVMIGPKPALRPTPYMSLDGLTQLLGDERQEQFLFSAHPFRYVPSMAPDLLRILGRMDGVEMNSVNILWPMPNAKNGRLAPTTERLYAMARDEFGLTPLYNTDGHRESAVGLIANDIDLDGAEPPADEAELAALLKLAQPKERQDLDGLRKYFGL